MMENKTNDLNNLFNVLNGFEPVSAAAPISVPRISLDKFQRFYINSDARSVMNVQGGDRIVIAYNVEERAIAVITNGKAVRSRDLSSSRYNVDSRCYVNAKPFCDRYRYDNSGTPYTFEYDPDKSDAINGVHTFVLKA